MQVRRLLTIVAVAGATALSAPATGAIAAGSDTLVWGGTMAPSIDPHANYTVPVWFISNNLYDNLYRYEGNPPELVPWLAESYALSSDNLTWTFKLRPDVKFHDGAVLTADDVVYSFKRALGIGKGPAGVFLPVLKPDNVTALDSQTVRFVLERPFAPFLSAIPMVSIVNAKLVQQHATKDDEWAGSWLASNEAGSGAYQLAPGSFESMVRFDFDRFHDFFMGWSANAKPIEHVKARYIQDPTTRTNAIIHGDIDVGEADATAEEVARMKAAPNVVVHEDPVMRLFVITMNNARPPLDNVNTRKCFSYAFDYNGFIDNILQGLAKRSRAPIPENLFGYPTGITGYDYDLEKAKSYCDKARQEGANLDAELSVHYQPDSNQTAQAAQVLQSGLREIGVKINIVPELFARTATSTASAETAPDMWVHWVSPSYIDPDNWIGQMYGSEYRGSWKASSYYNNPEVDALLRQARETADRDTRAQLYSKAATLVVDDAPEIYVYDTIAARGLSTRVENYTFSPTTYGGEVRFMSLD